MEYKRNFFSILINIENPTSYKINEIKNNTDLILSSMGVVENCYQFQNKSKTEIIYLFQAPERKRLGQLAKYCKQYFDKQQEYETESYTKNSFNGAINQLRQNSKFQLIEKPLLFEEYNASDLNVFKNKENWHKWQTDIYSMVFNENDSFKNPHPREIISLVDKKGNSGKSSFFKWLFFKHSTTIGRISYGTASQLRASSVNMGKKQLYIIDLSRSKGKEDREEDLLAVLEELKSGLVTNPMRGSGKTLIMEPPHIIVSSNYVLKYELLSEDRWKVYEIDTSNCLKKLDRKKIKKLSKKK